MRIIIDRFEEDIAVIEVLSDNDAGAQHLNVPRALFGDAAEGDTLEITNLGKLTPPPFEEAPHDIFERLRKKRKRKAEASRPEELHNEETQAEEIQAGESSDEETEEPQD